MVMPNVSVSKVKGKSNFGRASTGAEVMAVLSCSKAACDSSDQPKVSLHSKEVRGMAMAAYPCTNFR